MISTSTILGLTHSNWTSSEYSPSVLSHSPNKPPRTVTGSRHTGRWNLEENRMYLKFITSHKTDLQDKESRRSSKIFKLMAVSIGTRAADQCRSHHQKMQRKYLSISNIIENCERSFSQEETHGETRERQKVENIYSITDMAESIKEERGGVEEEREDEVSVFNLDSFEFGGLGKEEEIEEIRRFTITYYDPFEITD